MQKTLQSVGFLLAIAGDHTYGEVVLHPGCEGGFYSVADARLLSCRDDGHMPAPSRAGGEWSGRSTEDPGLGS